MSASFQFAHDHLLIDEAPQALNQNIFSINLGEILNGEPGIKFKFSDEMKISCSKCSSIISYLSQRHSESEWICEVCGSVNETNILHWDRLINVNDIEFSSEDDEDDYDNCDEYLEGNERVIVFCVDTSGSMAGPRIKSVKEACLKTIELLRNQEEHEFRFALITFDSTSKYYGNGNFKTS